MSTRVLQQPDPSHAVHRDTILFEKNDDLYWLRGRHLDHTKQVLGFCCDEQSIGFDGETAGYYMQSLLEQGEKVGVAQDNSVRLLFLQGRGDPSKVKSTTIGISPELLLPRKELIRLASSKEINRPATQELIATLKEHLVGNKTKELSGYGTLYVYQLYDMYEVDWELTTMPESVVESLLVAAHQTGRMLRCQLVEPKGRRRKNGSKPHRERRTANEPTTYGQMRFEL